MERLHWINSDTLKVVDSDPTSTPADVNQKLTKEISPNIKHEMQRILNVPYSGQLLAQCSRPEVAYAANAVSSFCSNPGESHWVAAKRILRYLKGTKAARLVFKKKAGAVFERFSDSDWGNDPDAR